MFNFKTMLASASVFAMASLPTALADDIWLITPAELETLMATEPGMLPPPEERSLSIIGDQNSPKINVISPDVTNEITGEVIIKTAFEAVEPYEIQPDSLRVEYKIPFGWYDLTKRVKEAADITADGVETDPVKLPKGKHRLKVSVLDTAGREGAVEIRVQVKDS